MPVRCLDITCTNWLDLAIEAVSDLGFAIVTGAVPPPLLEAFPEAAQRVDQSLAQEMGQDYARQNLETRGRLERQIPLAYDAHFLEYLELPATCLAVQRWIGPHAVLRSQTLEIQRGRSHQLLQSQWHMNFKVPGQGVPALDIIYFMEPAGPETVTLEICPGSHRREKRPAEDYLLWSAQGISCPAGSLLIMDAKLWHRERPADEKTRQSLVHQLFVPHFVKPFLDYPRLLGQVTMERLPERLQTYLGWHSRPPGSLSEFALPAGQRCYREGQWDI